MSKTFIYIPDNINICTDGFLQGFVSRKKYHYNIFIITKENVSSKDTIGTCGFREFALDNEGFWFYIDCKHNKIEIFKDGNLSSFDENCKCVFYNYEAIRNVQVSLDDFDELLRAVQVNKEEVITLNKLKTFFLVFINLILTFINKAEYFFKYSQVFNHSKNSLYTIKWLLVENKNKLKLMSVITSKVLDINLGLILIYFYWLNEAVIIDLIKICTQNIILCLKTVLNTLMDSPGGLKLNYNLNRSLGIFFFYHISLWRIFVYAIEPVMPFIFKVIVTTGIYGLSFQVAFFSDMISFLTLHVYCLYVYASRLYKVEIYGLISLWKLFLGRKYNPLRDRVDSFQYSHNQLFVGTLGFTIFLFLLPTIFLYYAVFTLFRSILLLIKWILFKLRFMLGNLPIYVCILWICNSNKIKGEISIEFFKGEFNYTLYANLKRISLMDCVRFSFPPCNLCKEETKHLSVVINNIINGNIL